MLLEDKDSYIFNRLKKRGRFQFHCVYFITFNSQIVLNVVAIISVTIYITKRSSNQVY